MSEDAPVNTGAAGWPDPDSAYFAVRRMQTKLHRWATEDPGRRFGDLFNLVYDPAFMMVAWERVSTNKGARTAGIDKATAAQVETGIGVEAFLGQLRDALKSGEFRPVDPEGFALTLGALMDGFAIQLALRDPAVTPGKVREHCMALVEERLGREGVADAI